MTIFKKNSFPRLSIHNLATETLSSEYSCIGIKNSDEKVE